MRRVTNCILINNDHILLIRKPRRGWYAIPGGKMEQGETIKESVAREFREETALHIHSPTLAGVFTFIENTDDEKKTEWMMFTFVSHSFEGKLTDYCEEGELEWVPLTKIKKLPMAEGDHKIFEHVLNREEIVYGAFFYSKDNELLDFRFDPSIS